MSDGIANDATDTEPAPAKVPRGFLSLTDAIERLVNREDPELLATLRRDDVGWLRADVENGLLVSSQAVPPKTMKLVRTLYDHPSSISLRTQHGLQRHLAKLWVDAEQKLWPAFLSGALKLVALSDDDKMRILPIVLEENGPNTLFRRGMVFWHDQRAPKQSRSGMPIVVEAEFERWLQGSAIDQEAVVDDLRRDPVCASGAEVTVSSVEPAVTEVSVANAAASDVLINPSPPRSAPVAMKIVNERRLGEWLTQKMREAPGAPVPKGTMRELVKTAGYTFSGEGFLRAWAAAVRESGAFRWSAPGRRSMGKSMGQIEGS